MSLKLIELPNGKILKTSDNKAFEAPTLPVTPGNYPMANFIGATLENLYDNGLSGASRRVYYFKVT